MYQQVPNALQLKAMEWLERLNLSNVAKKPFRSLSWGQQRLLLITRAMVKHPSILILDEPLQGLDGINRKLVKQFIEQLVTNSQTQLLLFRTKTAMLQIALRIYLSLYRKAKPTSLGLSITKLHLEHK